MKEAEGGWGVLLAGGLGVAAVLGFVALLVFGLRSTGEDGERVRVVEGPVVLVNRCLDERIVAVNGRTFRGGSLDRRYPLTPAPTGRFGVEVVTERDGERRVLRATADADHLPPDPGEVRGTPGPCPSTRVGPSPLLSGILVAGALLVVGGYGAMVRRFVRR